MNFRIEQSDDQPKGIVEQRGAHYGDPLPNMERTADLWSAYLGVPLTPHDVAMCMVLVKCSRARVSYHQDNYEDIVGYAQIASEVHRGRR